jgi:hypothetical protein
MAKTQTFGDKLKKQKQQELVNVKVSPHSKVGQGFFAISGEIRESQRR